MVTSFERTFAATRIRSISSGDDSFAGATDLGTIGNITRPKRIRASGFIGEADSVDFYKIRATPDTRFSKSSGFFTVQQGSLRASLFVRSNLGLISLGSQRFSAGTTRDSRELVFNDLDSPATLFIRFDRPTQDTRYSYQINLQP